MAGQTDNAVATAPAHLRLNTFSNAKSGAAYLLLALINLLPYVVPVPISVQLFINSVACLYIGSYRSISLAVDKESFVKHLAKKAASEKMTSKDAYLFPVYGSGVLFGLYVLFKYVPKEYLNMLLTVYFTFLGFFCLAQLLDSIFETLSPSFGENVVKTKIPIKIPLYSTVIDLELTRGWILAALVSILPTAAYYLTKHWLLNNLFGIAFSIAGIQNLTLPSFKVGFILLWGLFFYDIFWVYGTDVMVTVAKSVDAPIKLFFPINMFAEEVKFSMLGLGDIVIPGVFVAMCLRYDVDKIIRQVFVEKLKPSRYTPYFNWCFVGYSLAIIVTFQVMIIFNHAQPALLYLVPGCTFSVLIQALLKNETKEIFAYEEEDQVKLQEEAILGKTATATEKPKEQ
eukprot:CAMPEP_0176456112 /NCGR_PEP_ID=MMETSP0127-20121128/31079_1 /TAXON_ID=938130 /ORGANISM="Platyophrya macrostoma, Strain WH" /LENGTH=398 /DNA_ID=CAMNT_0017845979 /DNA_START=36 /DNA_END=1232 /DNA_ORIENTATION=+